MKKKIINIIGCAFAVTCTHAFGLFGLIAGSAIGGAFIYFLDKGVKND